MYRKYDQHTDVKKIEKIHWFSTKLGYLEYTSGDKLLRKKEQARVPNGNIIRPETERMSKKQKPKDQKETVRFSF